VGFVRVAGHRSVLLEPLASAAIGAACRTAFGSACRVSACERIAYGGFNTIYCVALATGQRVILRVGPPSRAPLFRHERLLLAREAAIHPRLAAIGPVIPRILFQDFSFATLPRPYLFLEHRPGTVWDELARELDAEQQLLLWREFGTHVRRIHAITGTCYGSPVAGQGSGDHADWLLGLFDELAADLAERKLLVPGLAEFRRALAARRTQLHFAGPPRLVHGDLWPRNVLVEQGDGHWRIGAILDAERAFWGEPAAEWIFSHLDIPRAFWEAYGADLSPAALSGDARLRSVVYRARGALQLILECWRSGADAGFAHANFAACAREMAVPSVD